jgi:hypothetical protein
MVLPPRFGGPAILFLHAQGNFYVLWAHALEPTLTCVAIGGNNKGETKK